VTLPRRLPVATVAAGAGLWRIHQRVHGAVWFGPAPGNPPENRFDAPAGQFRVCYFGESLEAAFVETLIRGRSRLLVSLAELRDRVATTVPTARPLRLARLHSDGLVRLSLPASVPHGFPYGECQDLALAISEHSDEVDGIEYRSRWDDSQLCVALFDRARDGAGEPADPHPIHLAPEIRPVLRKYGIGVV
jgi:hypothetical protein